MYYFIKGYSFYIALTDGVFKALDILSFNTIVIHIIGIVVHKIYLNKSLEHISNMLYIMQ